MNHKLLLKTALALQHQFERIRRSRVEHIQLPDDRCKVLQKWSRQLIRAQARRYVAATQNCCHQLRDTIQQLIYGLNQLDAELSGASVTPPPRVGLYANTDSLSWEPFVSTTYVDRPQSFFTPGSRFRLFRGQFANLRSQSPTA